MDYLNLLEVLLREHDSWRAHRDDADRKLTQLADMIRSTVQMLPPEQQAKGEQFLERLDKRPLGLTGCLRLILANGEWWKPVELRDELARMGFWFEPYKSNPLASIHTTLRRMVPDTVETKRDRERGVIYRLKRGEPLRRARTGAARLDAIRSAKVEQNDEPKEL
jgi:hypothetical protein